MCNLWLKRQLHINTDFAVTGWMLCVIPHIRKDARVHSDRHHRKQVNNIIKRLFSGSSEEEMNVNLDMFWTEYIQFDNKVGSYDADEFIWKSKDIIDGNSHLWHQKYSLPFTKVLGFVACRVTSKVLGIGAAERSWGDVKTIKSGKRSAISSDVSEKQSIVYTSACIESARIEQNQADKQLYDNISSHSWNEENEAFDHQLDVWGVDRIFSDSPASVKRDLRAYIEDWEKLYMKKDDQRNRTRFLAKYGGLSLYDIDTEKRYSIDDKEIHFVKGEGYALIGNPDIPDGSLTDHEYFCIHEDLFDRILATDQDSDISLNLIHRETSLPLINFKSSGQKSERGNMSEKVIPRHQIQRKRRKKMHDYSQKSIDDFELVLVTPFPKVTDQEKKSVRNCFAASSQDQSIENTSKIILAHVLRRWKEDKSNAHPSTSAMAPAETVAMKIYTIELKHYASLPVPFSINH